MGQQAQPVLELSMDLMARGLGPHLLSKDYGQLQLERDG